MYGIPKYGQSMYATSNILDEDVVKKSPDLMKYLPLYYHSSNVTQELMKAIAYELGKMIVEKEDVELQLNVDTATWGLTYWENLLGLKTNLEDSYENRRIAINAKRQGYGTVTKEMLQTVIKNFVNEQVAIKEYNNESRIVIGVNFNKGLPKNITKILETLDDIMPAHIGYKIKYADTTWDKLKAKYTWNSEGFVQEQWENFVMI